jgi:hypothetical protein
MLCTSSKAASVPCDASSRIQNEYSMDCWKSMMSESPTVTEVETRKWSSTGDDLASSGISEDSDVNENPAMSAEIRAMLPVAAIRSLKFWACVVFSTAATVAARFLISLSSESTEVLRARNCSCKLGEARFADSPELLLTVVSPGVCDAALARSHRYAPHARTFMLQVLFFTPTADQLKGWNSRVVWPPVWSCLVYYRGR